MELERGDVVESREKRAKDILRSFPCNHQQQLFTPFFWRILSTSVLTNSMGLPMDDIYTPTVSSGPTSGQRTVNGAGKDKLSLMDLIAEKTRVEDELTVLGSVLDSVRHVS